MEMNLTNFKLAYQPCQCYNYTYYDNRIENPRVDSSILSPATKFRKDALAGFAKYALVDFFNSHQICTYRINSQ